MSWQYEWRLLAKRIEMVSQSGATLLSGVQACGGLDKTGANSWVNSSAISILQEIERFWECHKAVLPPKAAKSLCDHKVEKHRHNINQGIYGTVYATAILTKIRQDFEYVIGGDLAHVQALTERAFQHLNREIVANRMVRQLWQDAFAEEGETGLEKLGAAHLLLHGIWAFKAHTPTGGRTDLVFQEPLAVTDLVRKSAEGLVLTEWKKEKPEESLQRTLELAEWQAERYTEGALGGFEVHRVRYLIIVSEKHLDIPNSKETNACVYRYINVVVDPNTPSKSKPPKGGRKKKIEEQPPKPQSDTRS